MRLVHLRYGCVLEVLFQTGGSLVAIYSEYDLASCRENLYDMILLKTGDFPLIG